MRVPAGKVKVTSPPSFQPPTVEVEVGPVVQLDELVLVLVVVLEDRVVHDLRETRPSARAAGRRAWGRSAADPGAGRRRSPGRRERVGRRRRRRGVQGHVGLGRGPVDRGVGARRRASLNGASSPDRRRAGAVRVGARERRASVPAVVGRRRRIGQGAVGAAGAAAPSGAARAGPAGGGPTCRQASRATAAAGSAAAAAPAGPPGRRGARRDLPGAACHPAVRSRTRQDDTTGRQDSRRWPHRRAETRQTRDRARLIKRWQVPESG